MYKDQLKMKKLLEMLEMKNKVDLLIEKRLDKLPDNELIQLHENILKLGAAGAKLGGTVFGAGKRKVTNKVLKTGTKATRFVINAIDDALDKRNLLAKGKTRADITKYKTDIKNEVIDSLKTGKQNIKDLPKNMKNRPYTTAGVGMTLAAYAKIKSDQLKKKKEESQKKSIIDTAKDKAKKYYT